MKLTHTVLTGCALAFVLAAAPVGLSLSMNPLAASQAEAAPAKKSAKAKAKSKGKAVRKAARTGKGKAAGKKVSVKNARTDPPSKIYLVDSDQLAPGLVETAGAKTPIELLAAYKTSAQDGDLETAAVLLRMAAGEDLTRPIVAQTNGLVGISLDTADTSAVVEIAATARAEAAAEVAVQKAATPTEIPAQGERVGAAHAAMARAPQVSPLICLSAYKNAAHRGDAQSAAFALACANRGKVDEADVRQANDLLGVTPPVPAEQMAAMSFADRR
ncbi:hypothetical protein [Terrihabitans sp. B22-R8]|uniref:hypothetical protein n=1 Tax=Terrihabitans sp. B22-R8 TaxID=3425128 RepID=UPI00403D265B